MALTRSVSDYKDSVKAATTSNVTLSGGAPNTLDGISLVANDRVLVKDQTNSSQNGIYRVTTLGTGSNGTWTRSSDFNDYRQISSGALTFVEQGAISGNIFYYVPGGEPNVQIGTTAITFSNLYTLIDTTAPLQVVTNYGNVTTNPITAASFTTNSGGQHIGYHTGAIGANTPNTIVATSVTTSSGGQHIGYHTGAIGANTANTAIFTTATVTDSSNSYGSGQGALQITGGFYAGGDSYIAGNLIVANIASLGYTALSVNTPMVYLDASGISNYNYEIGIYSHKYDAIQGYNHTGIVRNHLDNSWYFFSNIRTEPTATVDLANAYLIYDTVKMGNAIVYGNIVGGYITGAIGANTANTGAFTSLTANGITINSSTGNYNVLNISGAALAPYGTPQTWQFFTNNTALGGNGSWILFPDSSTQTTAYPGSSSSLTLQNLNGYLTGAIGANTPNSGVFTSISTTTSGGNGNVSVGGNLTILPGGNIYLGSTAVPRFRTGNTAPASPNLGDTWYQGNTDILYEYIQDAANNKIWLDLSSNPSSYGNLTVANTLTINGNLSASVTSMNITGGSSGYVLRTDGNGNLSWVAISVTAGGGNSMVQFNDSSAVSGATYIQYNKTSGNLVSNSTTTSTSTTTGAIVAPSLGVSGNVNANAYYSNYYLYSNGNPITTPAGGSNTMIQFNNSGTFTGATYLQYNLTSGNLVSNSTTQSTSTSTGALVLTGGLGVGGNIYAANILIGSTTTLVGVQNIGLIAGSSAYLTIMGARLGDTGSQVTGVGALEIQGSNGSGSGIQSKIDFVDKVPGANNLVNSARISVTNSATATNVGQLVFSTYNGSSLAEAMRIYENGNIITPSTTTITHGIVSAVSSVVPSSNNAVNLGGSSSQYFSNIWANIHYVGSSVLPGANIQANIGGVGSNYFNYIYGVNFVGTSTTAKYADLAEMYHADDYYTPGTVMVFGGDLDVTVSTQSHDTAVAGVISTNPAYLMNDNFEQDNWVPVALTGRVPCMVRGPVEKGTLLVSSEIKGVACALDKSLYEPGCIIGKSMDIIGDSSIKKIEIAVGRF